MLQSMSLSQQHLQLQAVQLSWDLHNPVMTDLSFGTHTGSKQDAKNHMTQHQFTTETPAIGSNCLCHMSMLRHVQLVLVVHYCHVVY